MKIICLYTLYWTPPSIDVIVGNGTILEGEHADETYVYCHDVKCKGEFPSNIDTDKMAEEIKEAITNIINKYQNNK